MAANNPSPAPMPPLKLSDEELAVLRECRTNSIYFRGLPLGAVSVVFLRGLINSGSFSHLKRYRKFYYPGIFGLSFLSGVASYRQPCLRKLMSLENSQLAQKIAGLKTEGYDMGDQTIISGQSSNNQPYTEPGSRREEHDQDRSFTMPSPIRDEDPKQLKHYTTYEELRERNRNQYRQMPRKQPVIDQRPQKYEEQTGPKDVDDYRSPVDTYQSDISSTTWLEGNEHSEDRDRQKENQRVSRKGPPRKKNAYGDTLE